MTMAEFKHSGMKFGWKATFIVTNPHKHIAQRPDPGSSNLG